MSFKLRMFILATTLSALGLVTLEWVIPMIHPVEHLVYKYHKTIPPTYWPHMQHRAKTPYYDTIFRANALGFNDVDHPQEKPPETLRVLLLGDSFVEGLPVPPHQHMARVLEDLAKAEGVSLEAMTLAMTCLGQSHQIRLYESIGKHYDPDLVVSFFHGSDLRDNIENKPFHKLEGEALVEIKEHIYPEEHWLKSIVMRYALNRLEGYFSIRNLMAPKPERNTNPSPPSPVAGGEAENPTESKAILTALIHRLKTIADRDETPMLGVLTSGSVIHSNTIDENEVARSIYNNQGIPLIDTQAAFLKLFQETKTTPYFSELDTHWNPWAHQQVARQIWQHVRKQNSLVDLGKTNEG